MHNNPVSFLSKSKNFSTRKEPPFIGEKRRRRQGMEANGGQTAILDRRRGSGKERGKYYEAGNGEKSNRAICQISPVGKGMRCAVPGGGVLENAPTAEKPPTGRFFWVVQYGSFSRGLFSYKSPLFCNPNLDCKIHPQRRLNDKDFRALRRSTKGFAFGNHSLLKKAGENFIFRGLV